MLRFILKTILYGFLLSIIYVFYCKWFNPPITITQLSSVLSGHGLNRKYIPYGEMGRDIKLAVIAGEDQLFPDHDGFDIKNIKAAIKGHQQGKSLRGASTISQQTAKNVFLWQGGGWFRKGLEVYFTFMIEKTWGKQRILEVYLNVAEMGPHVYGTEAAALYHYKKSSKNLTRTEAARIAACLPNPVKFTVNPMSRRVASRYPWVLRQMHNIEEDPDIQELLKN
ncbi:MAG: monofunctional biosynthetic peptidoglycan transglycosylase [Chitinophagaceae bacterium]|nr:monofunctional biosynthetic peptidoglycan transglycosylase [Chitinophagaceae bacterium]